MQLPPIYLLSALSHVPTCWSVPYPCTFHLYFGLGSVRPPLTFCGHGSFLHWHFLLLLRPLAPRRNTCLPLLCNCTVLPVPLSTGPYLGCHSGQFSLHLSHQRNRGLRVSMTKTSSDRRVRLCYLSTIPGTTPHCLVNTEGNVNSLWIRGLVLRLPWSQWPGKGSYWLGPSPTVIVIFS